MTINDRFSTIAKTLVFLTTLISDNLVAGKKSVTIYVYLCEVRVHSSSL